jgi:hypothetical protein
MRGACPVTAIATWQKAEVPPNDRCFKLVAKPQAWKVRMWRAFDQSVQPMLRLDCPISLNDVESPALRDLLMPYLSALRGCHIYLEHGAQTALPLAWSVGRLTVEAGSCTAFLHHVVDDSFGAVLATLVGAGGRGSDVTLSLSPYEIGRERVVFAMRDYDVGFGAEIGR